MPLETNQPGAGDNVNGVGVDAEIDYAGTPGIRHIVSYIDWSYSEGPDGGRLTIEDLAGAGLIFDIDITGDGHSRVLFSPPIRGTAGKQLSITLYAGGVGIVGKLNVGHYTQGEAA